MKFTNFIIQFLKEHPVVRLLNNSVQSFLNDNALKFSAALSYYTVFAIAPLSIIIIAVCGYFYGETEVRSELFAQISALVGQNSAQQIETAMQNINIDGENKIAAIVGGVTLLFGASGVFAEIQSSINYIWGFQAKPTKGILRFVINRLLSFSMIVSLGFILLVTLILNSALDFIYNNFFKDLFDFSVYLMLILNNVVILLVVAILFAVIYKVLPGGHIRWKDASVGACFTAVLFMLGKYGIGFYLGNTNIATAYGAAGSVMLILVWVYYSAMILYFGAEFTKEYCKMYGVKIKPDKLSSPIIKYYEVPKPIAEQLINDIKSIHHK
ncbi:YihY/virulence factor BrkB family protein [Flavobacterium agricola]|uniref:YihY/virulence factor BrkB family protein n=1 Tax=Flavobacterium agricola TaxID=2870839 RepID=A0ABY6M3J7_9FLAO|nr:YihY/virulence factor BrkB family protein [Flavobacterium agricola]UYW02334.1 YihY/virulence factor BrkB family protein [Flavobacterium agricola]